MKILLLLTIFLSFGVAEIPRSDEQANCIMRVNLWRKKLAKEKNIANMNRLTYDNDIQEKADKVITADKCDNITQKTADFEATRFEKHGTSVDELLKNPSKSKFACIRKTCTRLDQPLIWVTDLGTSSPPISGPAGSKCPPKMESADGLCYVPKDFSKTTQEVETTSAEATSGATASEFMISAFLMTVFWGIF